MDGGFGVEVFYDDKVVVVVDDAGGECFWVLDVLYETVATVIGMAGVGGECQYRRL